MPKLTICTSGKARAMPSASITGRPSRPAATSGMVEFRPPTSTGRIAATGRPCSRSSSASAWVISSPRNSFSVMIVGAPTIATVTTSAPGSSSEGAIMRIWPHWSSQASAASRPIQGLPPPPVPRRAAP